MLKVYPRFIGATSPHFAMLHSGLSATTTAIWKFGALLDGLKEVYLKDHSKMKKLKLYSLLRINPTSGKLLLLLYPPFYALWLLAIGKKLLELQNKSDKTFTFFASGLVFFFLIAFFIMPLLKLLKIDFLPDYLFANTIPAFLLFSYWIVTISIVSYNMVKYDQLKEPDKYFSPVITFSSTLIKSIIFLYYFISVFVFQRKVNEINRQKILQLT